MSEKSSRGSDGMSTTLAEEMKDGIVRLCGDRSVHDNRESWLARGARRAGISCRQAKSLFYAESDDPSGQVVWRVLRALKELDRKAEEKARESGGTLEGRLCAVEAALAALSRGDAAAHPHGPRAPADPCRHSLAGSGDRPAVGIPEAGALD